MADIDLNMIGNLLNSSGGKKQLEGIIDMLSGGSEHENNTSHSGDSYENSSKNSSKNDDDSDGDASFSIEKILPLMSSLTDNSDDDRSKLLYALKPYLSRRRAENVDKAAQILSLSKVTKLLKELG